MVDTAWLRVIAALLRQNKDTLEAGEVMRAADEIDRLRAGQAEPSPAMRLAMYRAAALGALVVSPRHFVDTGNPERPMTLAIRARQCGEAADYYAVTALSAESPISSPPSAPLPVPTREQVEAWAADCERMFRDHSGDTHGSIALVVRRVLTLAGVLR